MGELWGFSYRYNFLFSKMEDFMRRASWVILFFVFILNSLVFSDGKFNKMVQKGDFQKAIEYAERKIPDTERDQEFWYNLGYANENSGNAERALACYFSANKERDDINSLVGIARVYNNLGHYGQAVLIAHKAMLKAPELKTAKWEFIRANFNLNRWAGIDVQLYNILENDENNYEAKKYLGLYLFRVQDYGKAKLLLNDYFTNLKEKEKELDIAYKVSFCLYKIGQFSNAVENCKLILSKEPKNDNARLLLARIYCADAKYGLSLNEYKQIVNKDMLESQDYYNIAISYDKSGNFDDALQNFGIFISKSDSNDEKVLSAQIYIGSIYLKKNQYGRALKYFEAVSDINPNIVGLNINLAKCYAESGDMDKAILFAKKELLKDSTNVKSYVILIEMYEKKSMKTKAQEVRTKMEKLCPNSAQMHFELGQYYLSQEKYADALKSYEKSFVLRESNSALEGIAISAFHTKRFDKAKGAAESVLRVEQSSIAWEVLYKISIEENGYKDALGYLNSLVQRTPKVEYYKSLAYCYEKMGDYKNLPLIDEKILSFEPTNKISLERLAFSKAKENNHKEALSLFSRLESNGNVNEKIYRQMYLSAQNLKQDDSAIVYLKKYLRLSPNDIDAQKSLANYYYNVKKYDDAYYWYKKLDDVGANGFYSNYVRIVIGKANVDEIIRVCKKAIDNKEADEYIYSNLGIIYKRIKSYKDAEYAFSEALKLNAKNVEDLESLAECQVELNKLKEAIVSYEQVTLLKKSPIEEYKTLGILYSKIEKNDESINAYKKYLQYSKPLDLVLKVANYEYNKSNYREAKKYYEIFNGDMVYDVLHKYSESCFNEKFWDKAIELYSNLEQKYPKEIKPELYLHKAIAYEKIQDNKNAIKYYEIYSNVKPEQEILFKIACLQESIDKKVAKTMLERNIKAFPQDHKSYAKLGFISYELKYYDDAKKAFEKTVSLTDSVNSKIWLTLGELYRNSKDREKERYAYTELLKKEPQNYEANKRIGIILYEEGKEKQSLIYLELARSQNYNDPDVLFVLSHIYFKDGRHQEALLMLNTAKKLKPKDCEIRHYLLNVYIDLNNWSEAKREVEELLGYEKTKENLLIYAEILVQLKRYETAEGILKEMKEKEPINIDILLYLAYIYKLGKKYDDAMEVHKKISYIDDQQVQSIAQRAELYVLLGKPDQAIIFYEKAVKLDPKNPEIELGLAKVYKMVNRIDLYKEHIEKAYSLDSKNAEIIKEREFSKLK